MLLTRGLVMAEISGAQRVQIIVLLLALFAFGVGFYLYDRRHPELPRRDGPLAPPGLDPPLPPRPRPYVPPPLRPGGSKATTPPPLVQPEAAPAAAPYEPPFATGSPAGATATPDDLGLVLPPSQPGGGDPA